MEEGDAAALIVGIVIGAAAAHLWNSRENPPKMHFMGRRVHHGLAGMILVVAGAVFGKPVVAGARFACPGRRRRRPGLGAAAKPDRLQRNQTVRGY